VSFDQVVQAFLSLEIMRLQECICRRHIITGQVLKFYHDDLSACHTKYEIMVGGIWPCLCETADSCWLVVFGGDKGTKLAFRLALALTQAHETGF